MKSGWIEGMLDSVYHSHDGVGSTNLKDINRSPGHFKRMVRKDSDAFSFGRLAHAATLTPKEFEAHGKVMPEFNMRRKDDKAKHAEWMAERDPHDLVIKPKELPALMGIQESVRGAYGDLLTGGKAEISGFFNSQDYNALLKIRPDYLNEGECCVIDLKTAQNASKDAFIYAVKKYGYALSAAYYLDVAFMLGADVKEFIWIAVEKEPPYACAAYRASEATLAYGREKYREALTRFKECTEADHWPTYKTEIQELDIAF